MAKCPRCESRKGKRTCPALDQSICPVCCGRERLQTIPCPQDCQWLGAEHYQHARRKERAQARGRAFVERLEEEFTHASARGFVFALSADIYWWMDHHQRLPDEKLAAALEDLRGRLSAIWVPRDHPLPLTPFLHDLITLTPRYDGGSDPAAPSLDARRRSTALAALVRSLHARSDPESFTWYEEAAAFFGELDFEADLDYSPQEALERVKGRDRAPDPPRSSPGGLILPGS